MESHDTTDEKELLQRLLKEQEVAKRRRENIGAERSRVGGFAISWFMLIIFILGFLGGSEEQNIAQNDLYPLALYTWGIVLICTLLYYIGLWLKEK